MVATAVAGVRGASAERAADAPTSGTYNGRVTYTDTTDAGRTPPPANTSVRATCSGSTCQIQGFTLTSSGAGSYHLDTTHPNSSSAGKPCPASPIHIDATFAGTKLHYVVRYDQVGVVSTCLVDGLIQDYALTLDPKTAVTTTTTTTTTTAVPTTSAPGRP